MKLRASYVVVGFLSFVLSPVQLTLAQTPIENASALPRLVRFSGVVKDLNGTPLTGVVGVTFALYSEQNGGAALWLETQNVTADSNGHYTVLLGSTTPDGLPAELFTSEQARWVGVQVSGQAEQPRVLLVSAPYALKAGDAETIGGLPPSAFALASATKAATGHTGGINPSFRTDSKATAQAIGGTGTAGYIPEWQSGANLGNSLLFQSNAGNLGISTTTPAQKFEIDLGNVLAKGTDNFHKTGDTAYFYVGDTNHLVEAIYSAGLAIGAYKVPLALFVQDGTGNVGIGTTTPAQKFEVDFGDVLAKGTNNFKKTGDTAYFYVGDTNHLVEAIYSGGLAIGAYKVPQALFVQDETGNVGIGTTTPAAKLDVHGTGNFTGLVKFAAGQTFAGAGTVSNVGLSAPSSDFTVSGSPITTSGTLTLGWTTAPTSADTANAIVKRDSQGGFNAGNIRAAYVQAEAPDGGDGVFGSSVSGYGVQGVSSTNIGVLGASSSSLGVYGNSESGYGVYGEVGSSGLDGVYGISHNGHAGVVGINDATGYGVWGAVTASGVDGVYASGPTGVEGVGTSTGVSGSGPTGVSGISTGGSNPGVYAQAGAGGWAVDAVGTSGATGILAGSDSGYAGWFNGDVEVDGTLTAGTKKFKIDHPLDPANKYLEHASVESSEMMNIYTGNVTTDAHGEATVQLPEWFEALNTDFRYQLTVIAQFAQAIVARKIENHQFQIRTNAPNVEVSWQVTGVRQDAYAKAHPLQVEEEKPEQERGFYLHPELYGAPEEKGVLWGRAPQAVKQWKQARTKLAATDGKEIPVRP